MTLRTLTLDLGSSSFKTQIFDGVRPISPVVRAPYLTRFAGSAVDIEPRVIDRALAEVLGRLHSELKSIDQISLCNQSPSLTVTGKNGALLFPVITHLDRRSRSEALYLLKQMNKRQWLSRTGNLPYPGGIASTSLLWLYRNHRKIFLRAATFGCLNTYVIGRWTKSRAIDPGNASFTGLFRTLFLDGWDEDICHLLHIKKNQLPEIRDSNVIGGYLSKSVARQFGFRSGIPISVGAIDTSACVFMINMQPGDLLHVSGTSDVLATILSTPTPNDSHLTRGLGIGKRWLAVRTIAAGGATLDWCTRVFGQTALKKLQHRPPQQPSVSFDAYLAGDRLSLEPKMGAFHNLTLASSREDLLMAVVDEMGRQSATGLKILSELSPLSGRVWVSGSNNPLSRFLHRLWQKVHPSGSWKFSYVPDMGLKGLAQMGQLQRSSN